MAGHNDGNRVVASGEAYSSYRIWITDFIGDGRIGSGMGVRYFIKRLPNKTPCLNDRVVKLK